MPRSIHILALHGFTGSGADFDALSSACPDNLAETTITWLCPDLPGHGRNSAPSAWGIAALLDCLESQVADLPADNAWLLLGYSMGGRIALQWLAHGCRRPPLASVLIGASPGISDPAERRQRRNADAAWAGLLRDRGINAFCDAWEQQPLIHPQTRLAEPLRSALAARRRANDPLALSRALEHFGNGSLLPCWECLGHLGRLHLLHGERDHKFASIAAAMGSAAPRACRIHPIAGAGHTPHLEQPRRTATCLASIIETSLRG